MITCQVKGHIVMLMLILKISVRCVKVCHWTHKNEINEQCRDLAVGFLMFVFLSDFFSTENTVYVRQTDRQIDRQTHEYARSGNRNWRTEQQQRKENTLVGLDALWIPLFCFKTKLKLIDNCWWNSRIVTCAALSCPDAWRFCHKPHRCRWRHHGGYVRESLDCRPVCTHTQINSVFNWSSHMNQQSPLIHHQLSLLAILALCMHYCVLFNPQAPMHS